MKKLSNFFAVFKFSRKVSGYRVNILNNLSTNIIRNNLWNVWWLINKIIQLINFHPFISCLQKWISFFGNPTTGRVTVPIHLFCIRFQTTFIMDKNSTESFLFRTIIKSKHTISNAILGYKVHFNNFFQCFRNSKWAMSCHKHLAEYV